MTNPKVPFLDDDPNRTRMFVREFPYATTVDTAEKAIAKIGSGEREWDWVFLDHDLNGEIYCDSAREDTGMEVVRWIVAVRAKIGRIVIHSCNGPAVRVMSQRLLEDGYTVTAISFPWMNLEYMKKEVEGQ